ncbi:NAD-dependent epimerase/dehydratase family protein [Winogradskya humida]|uniref:Reductase n=1 Tax=Winogradskya humida TaxID=113566 RepID=A0ABQ3ZHH8_9ACTN|nr:NAD-dependent epimerase/dehydratase family protein [Actinoplanes humidus]GIE17933.1 reductase [Actinoplanes humidus]
MRLLILGGTGFAGHALIDAARTRGHDITVLNRGHRRPPPGVTALVGDRTTPDGLTALQGGTWDHVIDTWSAAPGAVRDAATALNGRAGRYTYISSRSVYADGTGAGATENSPTVTGDGDDYAHHKRGAELAVDQHFDGPVLHARAGLVLGPYEDVGRLPWWLTRLERGGPTLAPGPYDLPLQLIDVRDLADFVLDTTGTGAYNVVSSPGHTTMGELLDLGNQLTGGHADLRWTDEKTILDAGIEAWIELPIWLAPSSADYGFLHQGDVSKALAAGLRPRPIRETVADTWAWMQTLGGTPARRPDRPALGLSPEKESTVVS